MVFQRQEINRIEELLKRIIKKPFSEAKSVIEQRIDELLELYSTRLSPETKNILIVGYYRAAHEYADAKPRSLGGPYFLHPEQTLGALLEAGVSDPVTLLAGLFHDAIEENNSFKRQSKRSKPLKEKKYVKNYGESLSRHLNYALRSNGINKNTAQTIANQVSDAVIILTKRNSETYYLYLDRIFTSSENPEIQRAAIIAKFADRRANTLDLERQDYDVYRPEILLQDIVDAFSQQDTQRIEELRAKAESLAQSHPNAPNDFFKFTGDQKLHPCFKNVILENRYREWCIESKTIIPEVAAIGLSRLTGNIADKIINHLCTYHCGNNQLTIDEVYSLFVEYQGYVKSGGFDCVTRPSSKKSPESYDGILQRYFHQRIKGNKEALTELLHHRSMMFRAAVGFRHLSELYTKDPSYVLHGLTHRGIHPEAPVAYTCK